MATVIVGCKLPHGLHAELGGKVVTLAGSNSSSIIGGFGIIYYFAPSVRALPPWLRVHPISFLPMAVLMPVAYLLLTPLGLFTLDSSSWETRGHQGAAQGAPIK